MSENLSPFARAVEHYCAGLTLYPGCLGEACEHADGDPEHQCEGDEFSKAQCDSCGTTLAGARYPAVAHVNDDRNADPIAMSVCFDCVFYHAYGEEPEDGWRAQA